jgi:hypothetical protein
VAATEERGGGRREEGGGRREEGEDTGVQQLAVAVVILNKPRNKKKHGQERRARGRSGIKTTRPDGAFACCTFFACLEIVKYNNIEKKNNF